MSHLTSMNKVSGNKQPAVVHDSPYRFQLFRVRFPVCTSYTAIHLSSQVASLRFSIQLLKFHIYLLVHSSSLRISFSCGCCSLFHTLAFVLSPGPAPGCLPRSSTKLRLFYCPIASACFVFIYQLNVLLSLFVSFSHFAHTDRFLCFCPAPVRNFPLPERLTAK
jgi:hypothetical protein